MLRVIKRFVSNDIRFFKIRKYFSYYAGYCAEYLACLFMLCKLYRPLRHRYKNNSGEVDWIFVRGKSIVFVEVKFRTGFIDYFDLVSKAQKMRIVSSAKLFMARYDPDNCCSYRFDIVVVKSLILPRFFYIYNAWN